MSYSVKVIPKFEKNLKKLSRRYPSLKMEFSHLVQSLKDNPKQGSPLDHNCFKIRISIASKGKGKSGEGRIITNLVVRDKTVYLLSIYDKSDKENLSDKELLELLKNVP